MLKLNATFMLFCGCLTATSQDISKSIQNLKEYIQTDHREKVAELIAYPLKRQYPIPDVKDGVDFLSRYHQIFDDKLISSISESSVEDDWAEVGWRGVMFSDGLIWMDDDGKIYGINYQSAFEKRWRSDLIDSIQSSVHPSLSDMLCPIFTWQTQQFEIRVDKLENGSYRYASWSLWDHQFQVPDLILDNGIRVFEGTGGNHKYVFEDSIYRYECSVIVLGTMDLRNQLYIYYDDDLILAQDVVEVK